MAVEHGHIAAMRHHQNRHLGLAVAHADVDIAAIFRGYHHARREVAQFDFRPIAIEAQLGMGAARRQGESARQTGKSGHKITHYLKSPDFVAGKMSRGLSESKLKGIHEAYVIDAGALAGARRGYLL